jgi:hypothetical protein
VKNTSSKAGQTKPCQAQLRKTAMVSLFIWVATTAQAQSLKETPTPVPAICQQLSEQPLTEKTLPKWQAAALECQSQVPWLAQLGHHLIQAGQYQEAANHLERALLLGGQEIDTQIDYAIAMAGMGDKNSAISLLQDLLQNPQIPPALKAVLAEQQSQLSQERRQPPAQVHWQTQLQLGALIGRDSNLMSAPNIDSLTLTLGTASQTLPLDSNYLAQAGQYHRIEAVFHARRQENQGTQWDLLASTRQRASEALAQAKSTQYELIAERSTTHHKPGPQQVPGNYLRLSAAELQTRQSGPYQVQGLAAGLGQQMAAGVSQTRCEWRAGVEMQNREYAENTILNGQYRGLSLHGRCQKPIDTPSTKLSAQWHLSVRTGKDQPQDASRAGGDQKQTAVQVLFQAPAQMLMASAQGQWRLSGEWAESQDRLGYSPLLGGGEARKIKKQTAKIEYLRNLIEPSVHGLLQAHGGFEVTVHQSNISLFGLRSWGPFAGLRYVW